MTSLIKMDNGVFIKWDILSYILIHLVSQFVTGLGKGRAGHGLGTGTGGNWARTEHALGTGMGTSGTGHRHGQARHGRAGHGYPLVLPNWSK